MSDRCIPNQDVVGKVDQTFTDLDQQRTQGLERLQQIQTVQNSALQREQQRLIAKYGAAHPRVQKATARLTYNKGLQRDLSQEVARSKIDVPQLDRNTWKGHGFVLNKDLLGLQGLTISFVDDKNIWIRELGYACTDERGYFSILHPNQTAQTPPNLDLPPIFLTVTDANQRVLHRESTSRTVKLGQVDFWRIVLGEDGGTCEPPDNPDTPPGKAVQVESLDAPRQLTVNQSGSFSAKVNDDATPPVTSRWEFGDGTTANGLTATHAYDKPGEFVVTFRASNRINQDSESLTLMISQPDPDAWMVRGRVTDEKGQGMEGLAISLFDRDCVFDDHLGSTRTGAKGDFAIAYRTEQFNDLFDARPDLYIKVMDREGNTLYSSEDAVMCEAGRVEVFNITISR